MAWRPSNYLVEAELDNTKPGKVTGWMQFVGMEEIVRFDLDGDLHRDIRGAKIRLSGCACDDEKAARYMKGFSPIQKGKAGDITAGLPPYDYVRGYVYVEWFDEANGRVVLELDSDQVEVIGTPLPAEECEPISRAQQNRNMAEFLSGLSREMQAPAAAIGIKQPVVSDPNFTHWVIVDGQVAGEAHSVQQNGEGVCFAFVRLFVTPEMAEYGYVESAILQLKNGPSRN